MTDRVLDWWPAAPAPTFGPALQQRLHVLRNLAADEAALLRLASADRALLRAYCNPPSVILGLSRRRHQDVHVPACEARGIPVLRRASGGGTVVHDPFVVNFAWVLPWSWLPGCHLRSLADNATEEILACLIAALRSYGLGAQQTRISDVSIGRPPRKVAGSGQMRKIEGLMHHISLLVDLNLPLMEEVLPIPHDRPGLPHRQFVTSLKAAGVGRQYAWGHNASNGLGWVKVLLDLEERVLSATCRQFGATFRPLSASDIAMLGETGEALIASKYGQQNWIERL